MQSGNTKQFLRETFGLTEENVGEYADIAASYAVYRGLLKRTEDMKYLPVQFCLTPTQFPKEAYIFIEKLQVSMNRLLHKIAETPTFLASCFEESEYLDDFNTRLWKIQKIILKEGIKQPFNLRILRCDYMLHKDRKTGNIGAKLVENNTMAVAMPSLSPKIRDVYEHIFNRLCKESLISRVPFNNASVGVSMGLEASWQYYSQCVSKGAAILFIIEGHDMSNICDHRCLEFDAWKRAKSMKIIRRTFLELRDTATLKDNKLFVGDLEIAVVYYRWGYMPEHYTEKDWELRLMFERSLAVKIPTVAYQLAGSKKVQQQLTFLDQLKLFDDFEADTDSIQKVFVEQHVLELNNKMSASVQLALQNPQKYVVKPEREGGGNNIFNEDIAKFINSYEKKGTSELYILMEKLITPSFPNYVVDCNRPPRQTDVVTEIGIYGTVIATSADSAMSSFENATLGYVVKTKEAGNNEGGLCSGRSFIDSPFLC